MCQNSNNGYLWVAEFGEVFFSFLCFSNTPNISMRVNFMHRCDWAATMHHKRPDI